jgi:hypothetical protein
MTSLRLQGAGKAFIHGFHPLDGRKPVEPEREILLLGLPSLDDTPQPSPAFSVKGFASFIHEIDYCRYHPVSQGAISSVPVQGRLWRLSGNPLPLVRAAAGRTFRCAGQACHREGTIQISPKRSPWIWRLLLLCNVHRLLRKLPRGGEASASRLSNFIRRFNRKSGG